MVGSWLAEVRSGIPGYFSESVISPSYEGHDGLRLWDLESLRELRPPWVPGDDARYRGQVTCVAWLPEWSNARKTVCFGTALGYIVFWRQTGSVSATSSPCLFCFAYSIAPALSGGVREAYWNGMRNFIPRCGSQRTSAFTDRLWNAQPKGDCIFGR